MSAFLKLSFATLLTGLVWLVARYTMENYRPYKKIPIYLRIR